MLILFRKFNVENYLYRRFTLLTSRAKATRTKFRIFLKLRTSQSENEGVFHFLATT